MGQFTRENGKMMKFMDGEYINLMMAAFTRVDGVITKWMAMENIF